MRSPTDRELSSLLKDIWFRWIPAFAGMTKCENVPFSVIPFSVIPDLIGNPEDRNAPLLERAVSPATLNRIPLRSLFIPVGGSFQIPSFRLEALFKQGARSPER